MGRIMQNIRLCRKYNVSMVFASFAEAKWEMRSAKDLMSFAVLLGMTPKEAKVQVMEWLKLKHRDAPELNVEIKQYKAPDVKIHT